MNGGTLRTKANCLQYKHSPQRAELEQHGQPDQSRYMSSTSGSCISTLVPSAIFHDGSPVHVLYRSVL